VAQEDLAKQKPTARGQALIPNTFQWLGSQYTSSTHFTEKLDPGTQHTYRQIFESMYLEVIAPGSDKVFGDCPLDRFDARAIAIRAIERRRHRRPPTCGWRAQGGGHQSDRSRRQRQHLDGHVRLARYQAG
jgi:hypothetical protein